MTKYILEANKYGQRRLQILNKFLNPGSKRFLTPYLNGSLNVLDVGCGDGQMTRWIASRLDLNSNILGIDISEEQIKIAKSKNDKDLKNINFQCKDINDFDSSEKFDLIYSRFLQIHLVDPEAYIAKCESLLSENGVLVFEEPIISDTFTYPKSDMWSKTLETYLEISEKRGVNGNYGQCLYKACSSYLEVIESNLYNHVCSVSDACEYIYVALEEVKDTFISSNLMTENEINELISKYKSDFYSSRLEWSTFHNVMQIACKKSR